jgi:prepilin-type processing-associated H-X9-DG protein
LALHNYHESNDHFPLPGMIANKLGWTVSILPQIEYSTIADKMNYDAGHHMDANKARYAATRIDTYLCPSATSADQKSKYSGEVWDGERLHTAHYYGILGPIGVNPVTEERYEEGGRSEPFGGYAEQGVFWQFGCKIRDITDGTSNTLMIGEISWKKMSKYRAWHRAKYGDNRGTLYLLSKSVEYPINSENESKWNSVAFGSNHPGGVNFLRADGSVSFVSETVNFQDYLAMASRDGEEVATFAE